MMASGHGLSLLLFKPLRFSYASLWRLRKLPPSGATGKTLSCTAIPRPSATSRLRINRFVCAAYVASRRRCSLAPSLLSRPRTLHLRTVRSARLKSVQQTREPPCRQQCVRSPRLRHSKLRMRLRAPEIQAALVAAKLQPLTFRVVAACARQHWAPVALLVKSNVPPESTECATNSARDATANKCSLRLILLSN